MSLCVSMRVCVRVYKEGQRRKQKKGGGRRKEVMVVGERGNL
jgi:hypothetical protein